MPSFQEILLRIEGGFGEMRAEIRALSAASIERNKGIHRRVDRLEDKLDDELRNIRARTSSVGLLKVLGLLAAHYQTVGMIILIVLGALGLLKPETIKALKVFIKGSGE